MRIAVLERFSDPSRRCDVERIAAEDDEVLLWDLARAVDTSPPSRLGLVRRIPDWITMPLPIRERWRLLRHVARSHGERKVAVERLPQWIRELHERGIDEVACYSTKGFDLVDWFVRATGRPA